MLSRSSLAICNRTYTVKGAVLMRFRDRNGEYGRATMSEVINIPVDYQVDGKAFQGHLLYRRGATPGRRARCASIRKSSTART